MEWILGAVVVLIIGLAVLAGSGRFSTISDPIDDRAVPRLPDGEITADDLDRVEFAVVTRGYSPPQVDALLARLRYQLEHETPTGVETHSNVSPDAE